MGDYHLIVWAFIFSIPSFAVLLACELILRPAAWLLVRRQTLADSSSLAVAADPTAFHGVGYLVPGLDHAINCEVQINHGPRRNNREGSGAHI